MLNTLVNNIKSLRGGGNTLRNIKSLIFGMTLGVSTALMIPQKYYNLIPKKKKIIFLIWIKFFKPWR